MCERCQSEMAFVLQVCLPHIHVCRDRQLYAPLDDSEYHRTLYFFACTSPGCQGKPDRFDSSLILFPISSSSWRCFRAQLLDESIASATQKTHTEPAKSEPVTPSAPKDDWGVAVDDWGVAADDWGAEEPQTASKDSEDTPVQASTDDTKSSAAQERDSWTCEPDETQLADLLDDFEAQGIGSKTEQRLNAILSTTTSAASKAKKKKKKKSKDSSSVQLPPHVMLPFFISVVEVWLFAPHCASHAAPCPQEPAEEQDTFEHENRLLEAYRKAGGTVGDSDGSHDTIYSPH